MIRQKTNILFILSSLCIGGAERHVVGLINHLDATKFCCHLCYLKNYTALFEQLNSDKRERAFYGRVNKKIDFKTGRLLAEYVDKQQIDIIVSTNMYPMIYAGLAKYWSNKKPYLVDILHSTELESVRDKLEMLFYRPFFKAQQQLVYVSSNQQAYWQQKGLRADAELVIHNGIDAAYFSDTYTAAEKFAIRQQYGFNKYDYLIGICAVLRHEKNHVCLLQAVQKLHNQGINAKCLIIGDGEERGIIETQIAELNLSQYVKITGFQQDVRVFIASCDVMTNVSYTETFSLSALEAMSLGKPMLMSDVGGAEEQIAVGKNGYLFPVADVSALTEKLASLNDKAIQLTFGQYSRKIVLEYFTQEKMMRKFENLFLTLNSQA